MKYKKYAVILFAVFLLIMPLPLYAENIEPPENDDARVEITVDTRSDIRAISPFIYGINDNDGILNVNASSVKQTGDFLSSYNWERNFANTSNTDGNENERLPSNSPALSDDLPAVFSYGFVDNARLHGIPARFITLPLLGFAAADADGVVTENAPERWVKQIITKSGELTSTPDTDDETVFTDEYLAFLINREGYALSGGITGFYLDRIPEMRHKLYPTLGLSQITAAELVRINTEAAKAVKAIDPTATVSAPSIRNLESFVNLSNPDDWRTHSDEYTWFIDYYLDAMKKASDLAGKRLLDVLDLQFYTEAVDGYGNPVISSQNPGSNTAREAAPRIFSDMTYTEASKSAMTYKAYTPLLQTLQSSIRMYYPGTKLSFSEVSFGYGSDISGGIAAADTLGIFGREGVWAAQLADSGEYIDAALKIFTDYDSNGGHFGNVSVSAGNGQSAMSSVYAATEGSEDTLKLLYINKNAEEDQTVFFSLYSDADYGSANIYGFDADDSMVTRRGEIPIEGNVFEYSVPPQTVLLFEFSGELPDGYKPPVTTLVTEQNGQTVVSVVTTPSAPVTTETFQTAAPDEIIPEYSADEQGRVSTSADADKNDNIPPPIKIIAILLAAAAIGTIIFTVFNLRKF
ncbi:MAG: glycoside hydrolase family 44 protein [Ruminococcus sp.]|jgi:hypothetical protein|nr:glycoside hydrolase family 44 protein [Ruminococcus sp.]